MRFYPSVIILLSIAYVLPCCRVSKETTDKLVAKEFSQLNLLGEYTIPNNLMYKNTIVGGLSGIDYNATKNEYYLICDDRSDKNPARFYTANIAFTQNGIDSVTLTDVNNFLQPNGTVYPNNKTDALHTPDPEAIRYNANTQKLTWTSEGERQLKTNDTVLVNPSIININAKGVYDSEFILPNIFTMKTSENGPRQNGVFEGMTFADNYNSLFVNIEEPLYEDGPRADLLPNNAYIRIIKFDVSSKNCTAQYAYELAPVAYAATPDNAFKVNGVPDILNIGDNKLLVIERSFSTGRLPCSIKIFIALLQNATDIKNVNALKNNQNYTPATKKLLLNMDNLNIYTDNIEGVTFGPNLPNGHKTLLFVSDNNFNSFQKTQLLLFEVIN
jgi:hypothetical protein